MLMRPGEGGGTAGIPDPDVFVIGDAATIAGQPLPATAQVANQQAKYVAARLNALVRGRLPAAADADGAGARLAREDVLAERRRHRDASSARQRSQGRVGYAEPEGRGVSFVRLSEEGMGGGSCGRERGNG